MHVSTYKEFFTFCIINHSRNVFRCSCLALQEAKICCLLGPMQCNLLSFSFWIVITCYLVMQSTGFWIL